MSTIPWPKTGSITEAMFEGYLVKGRVQAVRMIGKTPQYRIKYQGDDRLLCGAIDSWLRYGDMIHVTQKDVEKAVELKALGLT